MEMVLNTVKNSINPSRPPRVALVYPGNEQARRSATPENSRFLPVFQAIRALGARAEPAVYHDDFADEVRKQLLQVDAALVWVNPIEDGRDRSRLDALLCEVAAAGVFVSTHPDVILRMGTKEVLYQTQDMGWGCDTRLYRSLQALREQLPASLATGPRVLKQNRGQSGNGVWKVEHDMEGSEGKALRVRHAKRGCIEEAVSFDAFIERCRPYFEGGGCMVDQAWQPRLPEGMVRCYLVRDRVQGFGVQAIVALHPGPPGSAPEEAPPPTPRLYHPPTLSQGQSLKRQLEQEWLPELQRKLGIAAASLPLLWDCDFLFGPKNDAGEDSYVLCEINVSSVSPFPESAVEPLARAVVEEAGRRVLLR